ncbi:iron complex transport system substrate-binding protein [Asanoa ferruginea]|uniref:Iron complex transport system substrate-binding protein n=1 Tax=Asanoa ferruginea TaxID=53367 RepID=A0A3E0A4R4_9ACTN|nr:iron-siderophore ABC transporter substrate-binding protein [Asanoa ferruginea]REG01351.1 iron complex transport system substrate-binding protein [Asanoa ferruginea]
MNRRSIGVLAALTVVVMTAACSSDPVPAATDDGGTQQITHAMGTTTVPLHPKRVVVLDTDKVDTAVSLGITPIGATQPPEIDTFPAYLGDLSSVKNVGEISEPDLEAIAALQPDLILGSKFRQEKFYDELSAIAPTVFTEKVGITWKDNFLLDGKALGQEQKAKDLLAGYEQRARDLGAKIPNAAGIKVSIVRFMPAEIRVYGPDGFSGIVVGDVGLGRPERQKLADKDDKRFDKVSPERIADLDGDVIFVTAQGPTAQAQQKKVVDGNLWKDLSAVKAGKAYDVPAEVWMTGIGVTAANKILDDIQSRLITA